MADKIIGIIKSKIKPKIKKVKDLDNLEYWLDSVEDFKHPKEHRKCEHQCQVKLNRLFTARLIRISVLCSQYMGIDWSDYNSLCSLCKTQVYNYYFKIFSDHPEKKVPISIFELQLKENSYRNIAENARSLYSKILREHRYGIVSSTKEEIESHKSYFENADSLWTATCKELGEALEERSINENKKV